MTPEGAAAVTALFSSVWQLFNGWYIPGTRVTPAGWAFFSLAVVAIFKIVKVYFMGRDGDDK